MIRFMLTVISIVVCCCTNNNDSQEGSRFADTRSKWENIKASNKTDYSFISSKSCFCPFTDSVRILVQADTISSIKNIRTQNQIPDSLFSNFNTIDGWFD